MHKLLKSLEKISFPLQAGTEATLCIYESPQNVPFPIKRIFVINAQEDVKRGAHAHKECTQLLVCLQGQCLVTIDDGHTRQEVLLNKPQEGLLIPPTLWAEQFYEAQTILMVFADQPYDEADYIRDYPTFLAWRKAPQ